MIRLTARPGSAAAFRSEPDPIQAKLASDRADPGYAIEIVSISPLAPWDYVTDGLSTSIEAAWTVEADVTTLGQTERREIHVAPLDGIASWFTDCGTPVTPQ